MDKDAISTAEEPAITPYRCARCGVESLASDCFIVPETDRRPPQDTRCIACERARHEKRTRRTILSSLIGLMVIAAVFVQSTAEPATALLLAFAAICLLQPLVIVLHELGHALTARALGLEVGAVLCGKGRLLWAVELFGMPVHFYAWPLFGSTYIGAYKVRAPLARLWLAVLMGPGINVLAVWATLAYWDSLASVIDPVILMMWTVLNLINAALNLLPFSHIELGQRAYSDGMLLMRLRRYSEVHALEITAPYLRALCRYERKDYVRALRACEEGLARKPGDANLRLVMAAAHFYLEDYAAAVKVLEPLLDATLPEAVRALAQNNTALALAVLHGGATPSIEHMAQAEALSKEAFSTYPCLVSIRATRALVLAANGRSEESLLLLDYPHYETASASERSHQAVVQALAFRALGRVEDSIRAVAKARELDPVSIHVMSRFGLSAPA